MTSTPRLIGPPGRLLELAPVGYRFPEYALAARVVENPPRDWDANWLMVRLYVEDGDRRWSSTDPAFTTWELRALVGWLRQVADASPEASDSFHAIEPNLQFEVGGSADVARLRALFSQEYAPPGESRYRHSTIEFTPGADGLRRFATDLEESLRPFPMRDRSLR
jgi:hypothetical protein